MIRLYQEFSGYVNKAFHAITTGLRDSAADVAKGTVQGCALLCTATQCRMVLVHPVLQISWRISELRAGVDSVWQFTLG
jgi:hypothetical protein